MYESKWKSAGRKTEENRNNHRQVVSEESIFSFGVLWEYDTVALKGFQN